MEKISQMFTPPQFFRTLNTPNSKVSSCNLEQKRIISS